MKKISFRIFAALLLVPLAALYAVEPIPRQGLALWLSAEDAVVENGNVTKIKDRSDNHNDAVREKDPKIVAGNPVIVKHEAAGQPVLRFNGAFTGYEFNAITNARTVFMVVSKNPVTYKKFAERHVIQGLPVGWHWCDTIIESGLLRPIKGWFNGFECDPYVSEFSTRLAVITLAPSKDIKVQRIFRDRDFADRSWYGDVAEIIIYTTPLADADRQVVEQYLLGKHAIKPFQPIVVPADSVKPGHVKPPANGTK